MRVRVVPSIVEFAARTGRAPPSLAFGFAAYLAFMRGEVQRRAPTAGLAVPEDSEGERVRSVWQRVNLASDESIGDFARAVCDDRALWGTESGRRSRICRAVPIT